MLFKSKFNSLYHILVSVSLLFRFQISVGALKQKPVRSALYFDYVYHIVFFSLQWDFFICFIMILCFFFWNWSSRLPIISIDRGCRRFRPSCQRKDFNCFSHNSKNSWMCSNLHDLMFERQLPRNPFLLR